MNLSMEKICKSFGANNVLTEVNFQLAAGEICALLGENGAGKSTLMNILGGVLPADSGQILLDGKPVSFATPVESLDASYKQIIEIGRALLQVPRILQRSTRPFWIPLLT